MKIEKLLSANDIGETGAHQAGICVPKSGGFLDFFPHLNKKEKNPRIEILFIDEAGEKWKFNFIYYNNKLFGGTRNEYRLTGMTKYFSQKNLKSDDKLILSRSEFDFQISHQKNKNVSTKLTLSKTWKIIDL